MFDFEPSFLKPARTLLAKLAALWKAALAKSDAALEIDAKYTRPGLASLLEELQDAVENIDTDGEPEIEFRWR